MQTNVEQTALLQFLRAKNPQYFGKVLEVRKEVSDWLSYVPATFPHYTRHTIQHSDAIIAAISQLLFKDGDVEQPVLAKLSGAEAYVLAIAAFLHDSGMVTSDEEKARLLGTAEWKEWVENGGGATRWREIEAMRAASDESTKWRREFLADLQMRYLIAEFIRRRHHLRAGNVVREHHASLGRLGFDNPSLIKTIADVCVAHGLRTHELNDDERFPFRRDLFNEKVNVRLLATLLRLGDLLDMSSDRACPLLLNAACPLPPESLAHWTQYQRIEHLMISHDKIEVTAYCQTQDEHRYIYDWCNWLVEEVREAAYTMIRSERHQEWHPPTATLATDETTSEEKTTIKIAPAPNAQYVPSRWTFQLDNEAVLNRLIYDTYRGIPHAFVRELIQNAADANRVQMYADLRKRGIEAPENPAHVDEETRKDYPISIVSDWVDRVNPLSGETERRQRLTITDNGIGMDRDVISKYFLQVGRSFYISDDFRRLRFSFSPTSQFGVGFLSSFAESDRITVDTYKPSSNDKALRLTLTGPRSYLLTEKSTRNTAGTSIALELLEPISDEELEKLLRHWCKRLEFPLHVQTPTSQFTIVAETVESFTAEIPDVSDPAASFVIRAFPFNERGIDGEIYVFARRTPEGEDWIVGDAYHYSRRYPQAHLPRMPLNVRCLHGINLDPYQSYEDATLGFSARIDHRNATTPPSLARSSQYSYGIDTDDPAIRRKLEEILTEHLLANPQHDWRYKQGLMSEVFGLDSFWDGVPDSVQLYVDGSTTTLTAAELFSLPRIFISMSTRYLLLHPMKTRGAAKRLSRLKGVPVLPGEDYYHLSGRVRDRFLSQHEIVGATPGGKNWWFVEWVETPTRKTIDLEFRDEILTIAPIEGETNLVHLPATSMGITVVNSNRELGKWLLRCKDACTKNLHGLDESLYDKLEEMIMNGHGNDRQTFLDHWSKLPNLPPDLLPPDFT